MNKLVLLLVLALLPVAGAAPESSWNGEWFIVGQGTDSVLEVSNQTITGGADHVFLVQLPNGFHNWTLTSNVTGQDVIETGYVLVHNLVADLTALHEAQADLATADELTDLSDRVEGVETNLTALLGLPVSFQTLADSVQGVQSTANTAATQAAAAAIDSNRTYEKILEPKEPAGKGDALLSMVILTIVGILLVERLAPHIQNLRQPKPIKIPEEMDEEE